MELKSLLSIKDKNLRDLDFLKEYAKVWYLMKE